MRQDPSDKRTLLMLISQPRSSAMGVIGSRPTTSTILSCTSNIWIYKKTMTGAPSDYLSKISIKTFNMVLELSRVSSTHTCHLNGFIVACSKGSGEGLLWLSWKEALCHNIIFPLQIIKTSTPNLNYWETGDLGVRGTPLSPILQSNRLLNFAPVMSISWSGMARVKWISFMYILDGSIHKSCGFWVGIH